MLLAKRLAMGGVLAAKPWQVNWINTAIAAKGVTAPQR